MKLSVALATHNEEENIRKCLESVKDLADEIVIVDGESNDKTRRIAEEFGAKILVRKNEENFHKNKQLAIDACKGDWILQLDADEVVSDNLRKEIATVVSSANINGYWMPRKNFFLGRWLSKGGQYPDYTLRLYRRGKGKLPVKSVHEQAVVDGKVGYLREPLLHYNYPDFSHYKEHFSRYTDILATEISGGNPILYLIIKPLHWFLLTYLRHKGFMDGYQGFLFSFFSSLRFPVAYIKSLWKKQK